MSCGRHGHEYGNVSLGYDVMAREDRLGGMAAPADTGEEHADFRSCHGSVPDIMGRDKTGPVAACLSGASKLDWLADRPQCQ